MQITINEEYRAIPIAELGLSTRTFNCLMRAGFNTLYLLVENYKALPTIHNMGAKSLTEIDELLNKIACDGVRAFKEDVSEQLPSLPEEILSRPVGDLNVSVRIFHSFQNEGIKTIGQALALTPETIRHMSNMGTLSAQQLQEQLDSLRELGEAYFASNHEND